MKVRLEDVAEIIMGQSPSSNTYNADKKRLPFYQGKSEFGDVYPIPLKWCSKPKKITEKNDILLSLSWHQLAQQISVMRLHVLVVD